MRLNRLGERLPAQAVWMWGLIGASVVFWIATMAVSNFAELTLSAPFLKLGILFWLGLLAALVVFFFGTSVQRNVALILLAWYFVSTLSFIFPYAVMHDSVINTLLFPRLGSGDSAYRSSYLGFSAVVGLIQSGTGLDSWNIARFFPAGLTILYLLSLGFFGITWRQRLFSSPFSVAMFVMVFFVFGDTFRLRINASPQTVGFLLYIIALALLPLADRSIGFRIILLVDLAVIVLTHPITPLLALPGLIFATIVSSETTLRRIQFAFEFALTFSVGYVAWTLYRADWVVSYAMQIVKDALQEEARIPIVDSPVIPQVQLYMDMHRVFLVAILIVLLLAYLYVVRTRAGRLITFWGVAYLPAFMLLFSYRDFFDRILLFSLIPCAVIFAEAVNRLIGARPEFRTPVFCGLIALSLLSAGVAYFDIASIDRITADEVAALDYAASIPGNQVVYAGGFNVPVVDGMKFAPGARGALRLKDIGRASVFIYDQQLENAVLCAANSEITMSDLAAILATDFELVYSNGYSQVYLRVRGP